MSTGWRVSLIDDGRTRHFIVGLADREAAKELAIARCSDASGIVLLPLKDGDFEKLALVDGQLSSHRKSVEHGRPFPVGIQQSAGSREDLRLDRATLTKARFLREGGLAEAFRY
ncbi:hypothetical protein [Allomesorhizobium alhagi]|uniref:hypothetical protein n=1 Tax=Allomesorhizobium alhagi TaxID=475067 RepID=UPI0011122E95|nr:hypothetical protein [Mesorhizobium alhagi]